MENVYQKFDDDVQSKGLNVERRRSDLDKCDADEASSAIGALTIAEEELKKAKEVKNNLFETPYFCHIEVKPEGEDTVDHYFCSENTFLKGAIDIKNNGTLFPFKKDRNRPISSALLDCYYNSRRTGEYKSNGKTYKFSIELICRDDIKFRKLLSVFQEYPIELIDEKDQPSIDDFLEKKLQENRENPIFRNIIKTLQGEQFKIVETNTTENFVVQGCAGSGKSQCLIHRLYYLRDELSDNGWEKVVLITPTTLFNNYSADLMRKYNLTNIKNFSITTFYKFLLEEYDNRFKNRQYRFEFSEEYLPDEYLKKVYSAENIQKINNEIESAISIYVRDATSALGLKEPLRINDNLIENLKKKLDETIDIFDKKSRVLNNDSQYTAIKLLYDKCKNEKEQLDKACEKLLSNEDAIEKKKQEIENLTKQL